MYYCVRAGTSSIYGYVTSMNMHEVATEPSQTTPFAMPSRVTTEWLDTNHAILSMLAHAVQSPFMTVRQTGDGWRYVCAPVAL